MIPIRVRQILLVDDDPQSLDSTRRILELSDYAVTVACDGQQALERVRERRPLAPFDLILSDVRMPQLGGLEFLRALAVCGETTPVVLMTAFGRVEDAVWAMKLGAVDFLSKPFKRQTLLSAVENALKRARAVAGSSADPESPRGQGVKDSGEAIVGNSEPIRQLRALIEQVAPTAANVLILGESGTGKELVAHAIHKKSARALAPFIALNCAAVPEHLIESELFGFEKGAFTGAGAAKEGLFEAAQGGTLLLDEIGDMPIQLQAKLLRTLQEGEIRRVGATLSRKVDVRVIAATHRDLREGIRQGSFRQDLLYRLEVVGLDVPALRDHIEDLPELAGYFLRIAAQRHQRAVTEIDAEAMNTLMSHAWPGNVRELSNTIERAVVFARGSVITIAELPPHIRELIARGGISGLVSGSGQGHSISVPLGTTLRDVEELLIRKTLEATSGDKNMTAKLLGINSRTIYRKLGAVPGTENES